MSYCYIVTERHASSTSSPKTSNSTIAARRRLLQLRNARRILSAQGPARRLDRVRFATIDVPKRGVDCIHGKPGAALHAIATATAHPRRGRAPKSRITTRRCTASGELVSSAMRPSPTAPASASSNCQAGEQGLQQTRNCAATTGAVSLLSERSVYTGNHECGPRTAACAGRLQRNALLRASLSAASAS